MLQLLNSLPTHNLTIKTNNITRINIPSRPNRPEADLTPEGTISKQSSTSEETSVGSIFVLLEENKEALGLQFYSVSLSTFDEVFLKVVAKHGVGEEEPARQRGWKDFVALIKERWGRRWW